MTAAGYTPGRGGAGGADATARSAAAAAQATANTNATKLTTDRARPGFGNSGMYPVASRGCTYPGLSTQWLTWGSQSTRLRFTLTQDVVAVALVYGNFMDDGTVAPSEQINANPIQVRASVESANNSPGVYAYVTGSLSYSASNTYSKGAQAVYSSAHYVSLVDNNTANTPSTATTFWKKVDYYPAHFAGENATRDVTIYGGQLAVSQPIGVTPGFKQGDTVYVNTYVQPNNGTANTGQIPRGHVIYTGGGDFEKHSSSAAAGTDWTLAGPTGTNTSSADATGVYGPVALVGITKRGAQVVMLAGDSIVNGTGETVQIFGSESPSWATRLLTDTPAAPTKYLYNHFRTAKGSSQGQYQVGVGWAIRLGFIVCGTHIIDEWGTNEASGLTLTQMQTNALRRWQAYSSAGLKVYATTITHQTTSTDGWVTVGNQTAAGSQFGTGSRTDLYNTWLRTVPAPLDGVIDVQTVVQDTQGRWLAPSGVAGTADGIHPTTANHILIAQSVNPATLFGSPVT